MIKAREIRTFSEKFGVPARTIDKDWVLGHILSGIFRSSYFQDNLLFKGGTCLRKCYFENYRFSEDLDFTSIHVEKKTLLSNLKKVVQKAALETDILFGNVQIESKMFKNSLYAYKCLIPFWGADHPKNKNAPPENRWGASVKLDFTIHEIICLQKAKKRIIHPYSDSLPNVLIPCYSMEEIVSEKLRAILQRNYAAPRDYYDLWYIITQIDRINWIEISSAFKTKCAFKNISFNSVQDFFVKSKMISCKKEWEHSLNHHMKILPCFDSIVADLRQHINKNKLFPEQ